MTSTEINELIVELESREKNEFAPEKLMGSGKNLPYYGWFWRHVDFDREITLAYADGDGFDTPSWVGFCENNKWDYEQWRTSKEEAAQIRKLCEEYVAAPSKQTSLAVFDYLQKIKPMNVGERRGD